MDSTRHEDDEDIHILGSLGRILCNGGWISPASIAAHSICNFPNGARLLKTALPGMAAPIPRAGDEERFWWFCQTAGVRRTSVLKNSAYSVYSISQAWADWIRTNCKYLSIIRGTVARLFGNTRCDTEPSPDIAVLLVIRTVVRCSAIGYYRVLPSRLRQKGTERNVWASSLSQTRWRRARSVTSPSLF